MMNWVVALRSMMRFDGSPKCQEPQSGVNGGLLGYDHSVRRVMMERRFARWGRAAFKHDTFGGLEHGLEGTSKFGMKDVNLIAEFLQILGRLLLIGRSGDTIAPPAFVLENVHVGVIASRFGVVVVVS